MWQIIKKEENLDCERSRHRKIADANSSGVEERVRWGEGVI
jgi:hypothetical protein